MELFPGAENSLSDREMLILSTALELFTQRGYFNTSVHDIHRSARVSIGSIYHYFKNKEGIAQALYSHLVDGMANVMDDIDRENKTTHDRCRAAIEYLLKLAQSSPQAMQFILYARHREFLPDEKPICSSRPFEKMKAMVKAGMETGEIRQMDPTVASVSLFGGAIRLIHLWLDGVLNRPVSEYLDEIWACAWRAVT